MARPRAIRDLTGRRDVADRGHAAVAARTLPSGPSTTDYGSLDSATRLVLAGLTFGPLAWMMIGPGIALVLTAAADLVSVGRDAHRAVDRPARQPGKRVMSTVTDNRPWSDADDQIIAGDLTAALGYVTPAGGVVVTPVAPIGLRDRDAGTVSFTTSLGFGRKLARIDRDPRVALAFHAREHGFATGSRFVLVQGTARYDATPDAAVLTAVVRPASTRFMGAPATGPFWDRWLASYYADRVLVTVDVRRVISWPDLRCAGTPDVTGAPQPAAGPDSQPAPRNGTGPRVDVARAARRLDALPHQLLGYADADGFPMIVPVTINGHTARGITLAGPVPSGSRRAGLLGHSYRPQLIGLATRQHTGWLSDGVYAPHTESGFRAPPNKTLLLLANGLMARRGRRHTPGRAPDRRGVKAHRSFDPRLVGRLEAQAWVAYYRREWPTFLRAAVGLIRHTFALPWPQTLYGAWLVLRANQQWAPYPDNDPDGARRTMQRFYALIKRRYQEPFDPATAARLEVEWWRVHRSHQHGGTDTETETHLVAALAALYAYVYDAPAATVRRAAQQRAVAMRHSDQWVRDGCHRPDPAIAEIQAALIRSYAALLSAVHQL